MKLLTYLVTFLFILLIPIFASAAEVTKTFAWDEPTDLAIIERWELYMGETPGGSYTKVTDIIKIEGVFQAPGTVDIIGPAGSRQTRYFVLIACGTVLEAGQPIFKCSADSNEVNFSVDIPSTEFKVPVNFRIIEE